MALPPSPRPQLRTKETLRIYLAFTWRHRRQSLVSLLLPIGNVSFSIFTPYFASHVLADMVTHGPKLWTDFTWFTTSAVIGLIFNTIGIRTSMRLTAEVQRELHDYMFARLLQRSVGFFNNQIGGKLVSDALDFVSSYSQLFNTGFLTGSAFALGTLIGLLLVFFSNWEIGLAITLLMSGLIYWTVIESRKRSGMRSHRLILNKRLTAHVSDNIVNAVTVKTFANESREIHDNRQLNCDQAEARIADWQHNTTLESFRMGILLLMQVVLVLVLILLSSHNRHLIATGIFAFTYTLTLVSRYFSVSTITRQIEEAFLQASPMTEILDQPIEVADKANATTLTVSHGAIDFQDVSFHYADAASTDQVFTALTLHIKPGEKVGLVGHSGGGKSTLTRLLLRFDDITDGSITIDGQDVRDVTQASLRAQIAYVPQEPLLFHRSIRENIAYGTEKHTQAGVERAATLAYAHDFIAKLPQGYDTTVGERGVKLSGGQRQRIAIARAILRDAPLLVLDEATSALDSESEKAIQKAIWQLMLHKTAIVIAHRLSTIQKMDRILVLEEGRITEQGTHTELLAQKGTYATLWAHQSGGFIEE